jgi:transposase
VLGKRKLRQESLFGPIRRETRVSKELGRLKEIVSFGWFREACSDKFADDGRPSIAPEVLGAMMLLGFWFNIDSDRELCEECDDRLSFREFIGISDEDEIPVHSSLTHWRQRLGKEIFQEFLRYSIGVACGVGLRPGRCRMFDSSLVKAQADAHSPARVDLDPVVDANDYLEALGEWDAELAEPAGGDGESGGSEPEVNEPKKRRTTSKFKHGGARKRNAKKRLSRGKAISLNTHDLDAKLLSRRGKKADFFHKAHFEFDASSSLVMNADAGHVFEPVKMVEFLSAESYAVDTVAGDTGYFDCESQRWLKGNDICSHISVRDNSNNTGRVFGIDAFAYDAANDRYVCPAGIFLTRQGTGCNGERRYASAVGSCTGCEYRDYCFQAKRKSARRQLTMCADRELIDEARARNRCNRARRLKVKRSIVCEGGIGTMKNYGGLRRARWLGEEATAIQCLMAGVVLNLKKALKHLAETQEAAAAAVLAPIVHLYRRFLVRRMRNLPQATVLLPAA